MSPIYFSWICVTYCYGRFPYPLPRSSYNLQCHRLQFLGGSLGQPFTGTSNNIQRQLKFQDCWLWGLILQSTFPILSMWRKGVDPFYPACYYFQNFSISWWTSEIERKRPTRCLHNFWESPIEIGIFYEDWCGVCAWISAGPTCKL